MIVKEEQIRKLKNVPIGGLFKIDARFFIKTGECCFDNNHINCVDVKSGWYTYINESAFVEYFPDAFISVGNKYYDK